MMSNENNSQSSADIFAEGPGACLRCRGEMVLGRVLRMEKWVPGHLRVSHGWEGIRAQVPEEEKAVITYRCVRCGYLESYAR